jgi:hypothetical protein
MKERISSKANLHDQLKLHYKLPGGKRAGSLIVPAPFKTIEARSKSVIKEGHATSIMSLSKLSHNRSFLKQTPSTKDLGIQSLIKKYPPKPDDTKTEAQNEFKS